MVKTPADKIRELKEEYCRRSGGEERQLKTDTDKCQTSASSHIGRIWFDSVTNELWVCTGRINGQFKWSKVSENLHE